MAYEIRNISQSIEVTDVTSIGVTPIIQDPDTGEYVRTIRFWAKNLSDEAINVLTITVRTADQVMIQLEAPIQEF